MLKLVNDCFLTYFLGTLVLNVELETLGGNSFFKWRLSLWCKLLAFHLFVKIYVRNHSGKVLYYTGVSSFCRLLPFDLREILDICVSLICGICFKCRDVLRQCLPPILSLGLPKGPWNLHFLNGIFIHAKACKRLLPDILPRYSGFKCWTRNTWRKLVF